MAVTEKTVGSQTATLNTEHVLATVTDPGIYSLRVFLTNLAAGDVVRLRVYTKCRNATDAEGLDQIVSYGPLVPDEKNSNSIPVMSLGYFKVTLEQVAGTGRAFPWAVLSSGA